MSVPEMPDWSIAREGDPTKYKPTTPFLAKLRALFNPLYHKECGGYFEVVGTGGIITHREYYRCTRCGCQFHDSISQV